MEQARVEQESYDQASDEVIDTSASFYGNPDMDKLQEKVANSVGKGKTTPVKVSWRRLTVFVCSVPRCVLVC